MDGTPVEIETGMNAYGANTVAGIILSFSLLRLPRQVHQFPAGSLVSVRLSVLFCFDRETFR